MKKNDFFQDKRILFMLPPFWDPQVPPLGIASLKSAIQPYGAYVKTVDANIEGRFREIQDNYYELLKTSVPAEHGRHLRNVGHDVLRNHMMAHLHYTKKKKYEELVKILVYKTFFIYLADSRIADLIDLIDTFYRRLHTFFIEWLDKENPTILGLSVYSGTLPASLFVSRLAKEKRPEICTVIGGGIFASDLAYGSPNFNFFLEKTPYIDKIFIGEGEVLLLKLLRGELPEAQRVFTIADVDNSFLDLSAAPVPDFSDFDLSFYPGLAAYTSRSCPFQCSFCVETVYWGKFRKKSGPFITKELQELYETYGYQLFVLCDSLLNPVITDVSREFIKEGASLYWDGYLRADRAVCDIDNVMLWRRGGFYRARLGLESGSESILQAMGKKISVKQAKQAVASLASAGIKTTTMWVIGYPGETEEDFRKTLDFIEDMRDDIYEADCNPFWYYLTGQVNSSGWAEQEKHILLYPQNSRDLLILQTWILDCEPSRDVTFERLSRFAAHIERLGIPNPYSLHDFFKADERWKKLHKNAVPSLVDLKNKAVYIDENRKIGKLSAAKNPLYKEENFEF